MPNPEPTKPAETDAPLTVKMDTHVGGRKDTPALTGSETGYFTNWVHDPNDPDPFADDPNDPQTVVYPQEFKVTYPDIDGVPVDPVELADTQPVAVEVPEDELTLIQ